MSCEDEFEAVGHAGPPPAQAVRLVTEPGYSVAEAARSVGTSEGHSSIMLPRDWGVDEDEAERLLHQLNLCQSVVCRTGLGGASGCGSSRRNRRSAAERDVT